MRRSLTLSLLVALGATAATAQVGTNPDVLNPNLATAEHMQAAPNITAAIAAAIVDGRPYLTATAFDEALRQAALTDEQRAETRAHLFVPINLNTASEADILLIPGVGRKMAHEFEEYRPYTSMEQFRREIGKYVDEDEVARLEMYVTLD